MDILPFVVFAIIATSIGLGLLLISYVLGARPKNKRLHDIYESGMDPVGSATKRYDVKFYLTAVLFLLFDVEIVFLFPWALAYKNSDVKPLMIAEFAFFIFILLVGYLFVLFSKSLDWED